MLVLFSGWSGLTVINYPNQSIPGVKSIATKNVKKAMLKKM